MSAEQILSYSAAAKVVAEHASLLAPSDGAMRVSLTAAYGRAVAEDVCTPRALPPFDRATRDGFAVRAAEVGGGLRIPLHIRGLLRAGQPAITEPLPPGEAIEIMTGAPMPPGADAVLMVEHAERTGDSMHASESHTLKPGDNVVPCGSEASASALILKRGTRLGAAQIAAAASCGAADLLVYPQPRVAIFATGDELVEPGTPVLDHQIYNSNAYSLAAQVFEAAAVPQMHGALPDDLAATERAISAAQQSGCDLLLFSGGVSMGQFDYVEAALRNCGAEFFFTGVSLQPGKPVVFGALPRAGGSRRYFFGLPGNPVSTLVTFSLFARPLIGALGGEREYAIPFVAATLTEEVRSKPGLTRFLPALMQHELSGPTIRVVPWQGSGDLAALARSNAFLVVPPEGELFRAGETMTALLR